MTNFNKFVLKATAAATLAFAAVGGVAHAQQYPASGYIPPETTYEPPVVPPETGPGTVVTNDIDNNNSNTNTNNNNNNNSNTNNNNNSNSNNNSNNNTANGGAGGNGGSASVGDIVNSFRSYAYAGGPAIGAAVDRCLAVTGTSGHIGIAGVNVGLGGTRATYNEQCSRAQMGQTLIGFLATVKDPALQALAITTLGQLFPEHIGTAIPVVTTGYAEAMARCNGRVGSAFDVLGSTCTQSFSEASATSAARSTTDVTVNVDLNTGARTAPRATAPRASAPRAAAPRVRSTGRTTVRPNADGSCPTGTTAVTTCVVQPRR